LWSWGTKTHIHHNIKAVSFDSLKKADLAAAESSGSKNSLVCINELLV